MAHSRDLSYRFARWHAVALAAALVAFAAPALAASSACPATQFLNKAGVSPPGACQQPAAGDLTPIAADTLVGNPTGVSASPISTAVGNEFAFTSSTFHLNPTPATALLNPCTATLKGLVPTPPNNSNQVLRGDCSFGAVPATRTRLTTTLTLHRATSGTDSGDCTSIGSPCLTRAYIWGLLINNYDLAGFSVVIQDADGTYTDSFSPTGNPVGNKDFTQITWRGHVGNPALVKWKAATGTNIVVTGGPAPGQSGFSIDSVEFDGATAAPSNMITTTQGAVLLLENVIFGCNPGQIDVNPSVGSTVHFLDYSIDHRLCSGVSTLTTTSGSPNVTFVASTGPSIAAADLINDTGTAVLPHTTFLSVNNGAGTAVLSSNATASTTTNVYYSNASLNHIQMDPQSVVDYQPTTVTPVGGGNFAWGYSGGFITNNNAQFFTLTSPTFGTSGYVGPGFAALNHGVIYSPGAYSLTALPGETHTFSGTFAAGATSILLSTADFNRLAAYANYVTNGYGIPLIGTGIQPGTVILNIPSAGTTIYLSKPTTALGSGATITYGGQLVAGGLYFGTTNSVLFPPDGALGNSAVEHISYQPGLLTAVNSTKAAFHKFSKASTVDNIEGSAASFTCSVNPTITVFECGTSTTCASSPVTIGTVTLAAAGTVVDGTVSAPAIAAGDYVAFAMTAGTCTAIDLSAAVQIHAN